MGGVPRHSAALNSGTSTSPGSTQGIVQPSGGVGLAGTVIVQPTDRPTQPVGQGRGQGQGQSLSRTPSGWAPNSSGSSSSGQSPSDTGSGQSTGTGSGQSTGTGSGQSTGSSSGESGSGGSSPQPTTTPTTTAPSGS